MQNVLGDFVWDEAKTCRRNLLRKWAVSEGWKIRNKGLICFAVEWDSLLFNCPDPKNLSALPEEVEGRGMPGPHLGRWWKNKGFGPRMMGSLEGCWVFFQEICSGSGNDGVEPWRKFCHDVYGDIWNECISKFMRELSVDKRMWGEVRDLKKMWCEGFYPCWVGEGWQLKEGTKSRAGRLFSSPREPPL